MPNRPIYKVTEKQLHAYTVINGAKKPCQTAYIARQFKDVSSADFRNVLNSSLKGLVKMGLLHRTEVNKRVVMYEAVHLDWPKFEIIQRGRRPGKALELKRKTFNTPHGSVTILDTGELTNGGRRVQNVQHSAAGEASNDDQCPQEESAYHDRRSSSAR